WLGLNDSQAYAEITAEYMIISDHELLAEINEGVLQRKPLDDIRAMQRPGRPDILNKVIKIYLKNTPDLLEAIHQSIKDESGNDLLDAAHSLKSSSANLGAMQVSALSKQLEAFGKAGSIHAASHLLEQLDAEYELACLALSKELETTVNV
ncbi:MAG: Hpt domain-containing protein, partial [Gammaproteobacteria bacterium]|nr:Hpt domain-containing protein [Gammaproteobacteria bacterium]